MQPCKKILKVDKFKNIPFHEKVLGKFNFGNHDGCKKVEVN